MAEVPYLSQVIMNELLQHVKSSHKNTGSYIFHNATQWHLSLDPLCLVFKTPHKLSVKKYVVEYIFTQSYLFPMFFQSLVYSLCYYADVVNAVTCHAMIMAYSTPVFVSREVLSIA